MLRERGSEVGGAVLAGEIKQPAVARLEPRDQKLRQFFRIAIGCCHVGKAGSARRFGGMQPDREDRPVYKFGDARVACHRAAGIGAGDHQRIPRPAAEIGGDTFDPQQRRNRDVMTTLPQI